MKALLRAQVSAGIATVVDLLITILLVGTISIAAPIAGAVGNVAGGATNFLVNRRWAYSATNIAWHRQAWRYALVWCGYLLIGYGLMLLGMDVLGWHYLTVKLLTMAGMTLGYNHLLHKNYVYNL